MEASATLSIAQAERLRYESAKMRIGRDAMPFHTSLTIRFRGHLDVDALRRAVAAFGRRHRVFRWALAKNWFRSEGGAAAVQLEDSELVLECRSCERGAPAHDEPWWMRVCGEEATRPFDYLRAPLARAVLIERDGVERVLLLVVHHLISDGRSMNIAWRDIISLYRAELGVSEGLPAIRGEFEEFAQQERRSLTSRAFDEHLRFWQERYAAWVPGLVDAASLVGGACAQCRRRGPQAVAELPLTDTAIAVAAAVARRNAATSYVVYLGALQQMLSEVSGRSHIAVVTHFANRSDGRFANTIGWFATRHLTSSGRRHNMTLDEAVCGTRDNLAEAMEHECVRSASGWAAFGTKGARGHANLTLDVGRFVSFDVWVRETVTNLAGSDVCAERLDTRYMASRVMLAFRVVRRQQSSCLRAIYATNQFDSETIGEMLLKWNQRVLQAVEWRVGSGGGA